ncbi:unnamed protein product [Medioppia subpectinata]|uniref:Replication protein A C-terminal domain-containing protein n=1 Tax=Medioppia subpectinata TaxID=1979941 RepID=A0A7R9PY09_9ACAR|nr:unnamed protein product [Medioppia subpectinata]CAG2105392.1 unnamed protein product [Medioppia subpectinata]
MDLNQSGGYFVSQFDPNTGGGGPGGGGGGGGGSGGASGDRKNLVSVSLSQVIHLTTKDDGLVLHRQKIHSLVAIGLVVNIEELTTKNIYRIDDHTRGAPIEVQYWKNEDIDASNSRYVCPPPVMEKTYVRVIGQSRYDDNKPFIVAFRVEPILDPNEIYLHFLEVIADSIVLQKRKIQSLSHSGASEAMDTRAAHSTPGLGGGGGGGGNHLQGFSNVQKTILNMIKQSDESSAGVHRSAIIGSIPGVSSHEISTAINFLANEGHIFSTTDEDTFKSTDQP